MTFDGLVCVCVLVYFLPTTITRSFLFISAIDSRSFSFPLFSVPRTLYPTLPLFLSFCIFFFPSLRPFYPSLSLSVFLSACQQKQRTIGANFVNVNIMEKKKKILYSPFLKKYIYENGRCVHVDIIFIGNVLGSRLVSDWRRRPPPRRCSTKETTTMAFSVVGTSLAKQHTSIKCVRKLIPVNAQRLYLYINFFFMY